MNRQNQPTVPVCLTRHEIDHLLNLLIDRREDGSYYRKKDEYYARTDFLIELLRDSERRLRPLSTSGSQCKSTGAASPVIPWKLTAFRQHSPIKPWCAVAERIVNGVRHLINAEGSTPKEAGENLRKLLENRP